MTRSVAEATRLALEAWKAYQPPDSFENELDPRVQEHRCHALRRGELGFDCLPFTDPKSYSNPFLDDARRELEQKMTAEETTASDTSD